MLDPALIAEEEELAREELASLGAGEEGALKLLDLALLAFLGSQVVLPIACSFVQNVLWERYKRIRTEADAEGARKALASAEPGPAPVDRELVVGEVIEGLLEEGVPPRDAARIAQQTYERMRARLAAAG